MSRRIGLTVPDEFYAWLSEKASSTGLSVAPYCLMVLTQHKKSVESQMDLSAMMNILAKLPPEMIQAEMQKMSKDKDEDSGKQ